MKVTIAKNMPAKKSTTQNSGAPHWIPMTDSPLNPALTLQTKISEFVFWFGGAKEIFTGKW